MERPEFLDSLEEAAAVASDYLKVASEGIISDDISKFPVFVFHQGGIEFGEDITSEASTSETGWFVRATTAEELIKFGIIELEKAKLFIAGYKNPETHACILSVVPPNNIHLIYFPYK